MRLSVIVPQSMQHLVEGKPKLFSSMPPVFPDVLSSAEENLRVRTTRMDCVRASEQCLKEQACSTKYRTMRQCVAGGKESNFSSVAGLEAKDECRSAMDALKQSPLYNCRCKRGMKKEKNCLRIYWGIYQTLQGNISSVKEKTNKQTVLFHRVMIENCPKWQHLTPFLIFYRMKQWNYIVVFQEQ